MFKKMTVLVSFVVAAALAGSAHADTGITPEPIDTGGVRWLVTPPGFLTPFNYGTLTAQAYSVSYAVQARSGCFVVSKGADVFGGWLPIAVGAPRLAALTGAPLLPTFVVRDPAAGASRPSEAVEWTWRSTVVPAGTSRRVAPVQ